MTLYTCIAQIADLNAGHTLFVRLPWSLESEVIVSSLTGDLKIPKEIIDKGYSYFLEIHIAKEVLEVFKDHNISIEDKGKALIYYAEYDAYPDWIYND